MNTSNELLLSIINSKKDELLKKKNETVYFNDIDLIKLYHQIEKKKDNIKNLDNDLIEEIVNSSSAKNKEKFINSIENIRDLYIGQEKYKLNVNFKPKFSKDISTFLDIMREYIESKNKGLIDLEEYLNSLDELLDKIVNNELIINFSFVEKIVNDYNAIDFETNYYKIMEYISMHNLAILKTPDNILPVVETKTIKSIEEDEDIKEIFAKVGCSYKDLTSEILARFVTVNRDILKNNFRLMSKNKAENYGILHLISKNNFKAKLIIMLYSDPETIKNVVDLTRDINGKINVPLLKSVCNNVATCFIKDDNDNYKPMYETFKKNIEMLKSLEINYPALIKNAPLFMIISPSDLSFTLNHLEEIGFTKKQVINKCYKTLAINPSLIVKNANFIKNTIVDFDKFISESKNYVLLKVESLEDYVKYLKKNDKETITYKCLTNNLEELVVESLKDGD